MINEKLIERINFLANKKKKEGLSEVEIAEQNKLRKEYLEHFKKGFKQQLNAVEIVDKNE